MKKKTAHNPCSQPTRCAIYARTATVKKPNEDNSLTGQVAKCKRFAKGKEWIVREDCIFIDSGQSGLKMNSGLKDLISAAVSNPKPFEVLLCTATDRIARDTSLVIRIHETLTKCGVDIRFAGPWPSPALTKST
jgi:DNA invertase Pin-like site-specific DNA recombinase